MRRLLGLVVIDLLGSLHPGAAAAARGARPVQVQMRNVALHVDDRVVLNVRRLRGALVSTRRTMPPVFDDKQSFVVHIDSGEIAVAPDALSELMNRYMFNDQGSPIRHVAITIEGQRLKVTGSLHKGVDVPFTVVADPLVDDRGNLRLHPVSMKALGVPAGKLLSMFGLGLDTLVKVKGNKGMRVEGNDFVLDPSSLVPSPRIQGRLQAVRVEPNAVVEMFGPGREAALHPPNAKANYMYYRGGVLRFGKLTMTDADMELIDQHSEDPFDFFQDRYNEQLVAGYSKNTPEHGLEVFMPDYHRLRASRVP